jgi:hypothetical protein
MSKTDDQIKSEIEDNASRAEWGAWAIVVGLVVEIILATGISLGIEKNWLENWGAVAADCLIALGVYCEIHFGRKASRGEAELRRRSEQKVAEATERAAEAQLRAAEADLARVKLEEKLAPRQLSLAQRNELIDRLKSFPGMIAHFWIYPAGTADTYWFGDLLYNLVQGAEWDAAKWILTTGIPSPVGGITITWRDGSLVNKQAAETFADGLREAGIYAVASNAFSEHDQTIGPQRQPAIPVLGAIRPPTIRIFVATKPQ